MMRTLVTGGTGFVGANLIRRLLRDGHAVHALVRTLHPAWRLQDIAGDLHLHEADVRDQQSVRRAVHEVKPDWLFHLAVYGAYSSQTGMDQMIATNLTGCVNVLDACAETDLQAFVQTGSSSEYGYKDHPACEDEALSPGSHYAITKAAATYYCQHTARARRLPVAIARLYSVYGPYEEPGRLIPALITRGLEHGFPPLVSPDVARDFVHVDEVVEALLVLASAAGRINPGAVFNICSGAQTTIRQAVGLIRDLLAIPAEPHWSTMPNREWDTTVWVGNPDLTRRVIGWSPRLNFRTGLERTVRWFQDNPGLLDRYRGATPPG